VSTIAGSQGRTCLQLIAEMRPLVRGNRSLPAWIQTRLAKEKRFGSRDRRLYRELLYTAVRYWPWMEELASRGEDKLLNAVVWLAADSPATAPLKAMLPVHLRQPPTQDVENRAKILGVAAPLLPEWVADECPRAAEPEELNVLHSRAPVWLRVQTQDLRQVTSELDALGWAWRSSHLAPDALELLGDVDITRTKAFEHGWVEVQDIGSQLLLRKVGVLGGTNWLDACAGAGGKTLQLGFLVGPGGSVTAHDVRAEALKELEARCRRARLRNVQVNRHPTGKFDGVLVDAPCTGSGTWRRAPHLKWCTEREDIVRAARLQSELLARYATHVAPGGRLVYATCSLCRTENYGVANSFLERNREFRPVRLDGSDGSTSDLGVTFWPSRHNGDGFFVAAFERGDR
jgi:16S rRNA (cytosine967-C5)-methyltransferase